MSADAKEAATGSTTASVSAATSDSGFDGVTDDRQATAAATDTPTSQAAHQADSDNAAAPSASHSSAALSVQSASIGAGIEGLVLYDLTNVACDGGEGQASRAKEFSPHCVKTLMDLRLLGIGYERKRLTFHQVRTQLAHKTGDQSVTVPLLELADGTHLKDSWTIAGYLAEADPQYASALFPNGAASRSFAALVNAWGKGSFAPHLGPLSRPALFKYLDDLDSQTYFEHVKVGRKKMEAFRSLTSEQRQGSIDGCIAALELIQVALKAAEDAQSPRSPAAVWLEGAAHPTHADFCVYGWYVHTRSLGPTTTRAIWHAHPHVARWVSSLNAWAGPAITNDFL